MIFDIFPSYIYQHNNVLPTEVLQQLHDHVIINCAHASVIPFADIMYGEEIKKIIINHASVVIKKYGFSDVLLSERLCFHYFPVGKVSNMEIHSDDFGDIGKKFVCFVYLSCDPNAGGELEIFDPRWLNGPWHEMSKTFKIQPSANKIVIFPSFLWHRVNDYFSNFIPRLAFDCVISVK